MGYFHICISAHLNFIFLVDSCNIRLFSLSWWVVTFFLQYTAPLWRPEVFHITITEWNLKTSYHAPMFVKLCVCPDIQRFCIKLFSCKSHKSIYLSGVKTRHHQSFVFLSDIYIRKYLIIIGNTSHQNFDNSVKIAAEN